MSTLTLTSKGQTTMPKDVRKRLNLHPVDRLEFVIDEDGRVLVLPVRVDASELAGMLKRPARGPAMIGIDTNVLVRHVVQDDFGQSRTATRLVPRHCTCDDRESPIERREPL